MNRKKLINIIYSIIFILIVLIGIFYVTKITVKNDIEIPVLTIKLDGSSVIVEATDNVGISAYTYNNENKIPSKWYEANNKKVFNKTLKVLSSDTYYVWVKDLNGNISEVKTLTLNCSSGNYNKIDSDTVYCPYSKIEVFGFSWHVLSDENGYITLFMDSNQLPEMNHCDTLLTSEYCYYISNTEYDSYSWNKSIISKYLNTEFLTYLSSVNIKEESICSDRSGQDGCFEDDGCAGYLNSEINDYGFICHNQYVSSKVRLLTYVEYNEILSSLSDEDKSWVYGNEKFWTMIGWNTPPYAGSIDINGKFIVDEKTTNKLDVRPVITIKK